MLGGTISFVCSTSFPERNPMTDLLPKNQVPTVLAQQIATLQAIKENTAPVDPQGTNVAVPHTQFATGAVRGEEGLCRFDLIPPAALRRYAMTCKEGSLKYGDYNMLNGLPMENLRAHAMEHLNLYAEGDTSEDHLAHALWNIGLMIHQQETRPDLASKPFAEAREKYAKINKEGQGESKT